MSLRKLQKKFPAEESRQIVVTEVTRMTGGLVCVAGLDIHTGVMVRPLQPSHQNWPEDKWVETGYLVVGNIISLTAAKAESSNFPHASEDFCVARVAGESRLESDLI